MTKVQDLNFTSSAEWQLDDLLKNLPLLGDGGAGQCYRWNDRVIKIFDGQDYCTKATKEELTSCSYDLSDMPNHFNEVDETLFPTRETILRYASIENATFVFPDGVFYVDGKIKGLMMPYIVSTPLMDFKVSSTKLSHLIKACQKVKEDIKKISDLGIEMQDTAASNIYFDGNAFKIADTLDYIDHNVSEKDTVLKTNLRQFSQYIIPYFTRNQIRKSLVLNKNLLDLYRSQSQIEDPSHYFQQLKEHLSDVCDRPIDTLSSAEKILAKRK